MTTKSEFRGHPIIWIGDTETGYWVYEDTKERLPATGGDTRPCMKCGSHFTLGEGEVDTCLGILPGVDNACCGHGNRELAYVRFTNGVVLKGFVVEALEIKEQSQ